MTRAFLYLAVLSAALWWALDRPDRVSVVRDQSAFEDTTPAPRGAVGKLRGYLEVEESLRQMREVEDRQKTRRHTVPSRYTDHPPPRHLIELMTQNTTNAVFGFDVQTGYDDDCVLIWDRGRIKCLR